jgi:hypothetical protein
MTRAATEYNAPETHSIVLRPSQSAEGPATVTLATAPIRVDATTNPSSAGVASKLNSGFRYNNAPAKTHTIPTHNLKLFKSAPFFHPSTDLHQALPSSNNLCRNLSCKFYLQFFANLETQIIAYRVSPDFDKTLLNGSNCVVK